MSSFGPEAQMPLHMNAVCVYRHGMTFSSVCNQWLLIIMNALLIDKQTCTRQLGRAALSLLSPVHRVHGASNWISSVFRYRAQGALCTNIGFGFWRQKAETSLWREIKRGRENCEYYPGKK